MSKRKKNYSVKKLIDMVLYYIPALIFMVIYSTIPAIPFVNIDTLANVFVLILFVAGILLTCKQVWGGLVGIAGCLFAVICSWIDSGKIHTGIILVCSIVCIIYVYDMMSMD